MSKFPRKFLKDFWKQKIKITYGFKHSYRQSCFCTSGSIIPSKITVGFVAGGGEYSDLSERRVANPLPLWQVGQPVE